MNINVMQFIFLKTIQLLLNSFAQTTISSVIAVHARIQVLLPSEAVRDEEARAHIYFPTDPNNTNFLFIIGMWISWTYDGDYSVSGSFCLTASSKTSWLGVRWAIQKELHQSMKEHPPMFSMKIAQAMHRNPLSRRPFAALAFAQRFASSVTHGAAGVRDFCAWLVPCSRVKQV